MNKIQLVFIKKWHGKKEKSLENKNQRGKLQKTHHFVFLKEKETVGMGENCGQA